MGRWIEAEGVLFLFLRQEKKVNRRGGEKNDDADTDVCAETRFLLACDSART